MCVTGFCMRWKNISETGVGWYYRESNIKHSKSLKWDCLLCMMRSRKHFSISRIPYWRHVHYRLYAQRYRILFESSWEKKILEPAAMIRKCDRRPALDFLHIITPIIKWTRAKALRLGHVHQDWMCCWRLASGASSSYARAEMCTRNSCPCGESFILRYH